MSRLHTLRLLNDNMRTALLGVVMMSREFYELPETIKNEALRRVRAYSSFGKDGHHDAGLILMAPPIRWHIEYRTANLKGRSRDPLDCNKTIRVLILEVAN